MANEGSLFAPLNIGPIDLPEQPTGSQGSLFGLAKQKGFDLEQAVERNKQNVENAIANKIGLGVDNPAGQWVNLAASAASGLSRDVVGRLATLPLDVIGGMAQASVPEEEVQAYNRTQRGEATPEDAAMLAQIAPGDDGIPQTYLQRIQGAQGIQDVSQKVADFFDISSIVDTTRRDNLSESLREETAGGVAKLREAYEKFQKGEYGDAYLTAGAGTYQTLGNALYTGVTDPGATAEYVAENIPQLLAYGLSPATGVATNLGYGADLQRKGMTEYAEKNQGQLPDADERRSMALWAAAAAAAEQVGDVGMLRGMRASTGGVDDVIGGVVTSSAREGVTEGFQTVAENKAQLKDTSLEEIVEGATIGALVGGSMHGGSEVISAGKNARSTVESTQTQASDDLVSAAMDSGDVTELAAADPVKAVAVLSQLSQDAEPEVVQRNLQQADQIEATIQEQLDGVQARMENNSPEAVQEFRDILSQVPEGSPDHKAVTQALQEMESYTPAMRTQDEAAVTRLNKQLTDVRQVSERLRVDSTPDVEATVGAAQTGDKAAVDTALTLTMQNPDAIEPSVAAELSRNESLSMEQRDAMAKFAVAQEASNTLKDRGAVNSDVFNGGVGFKGLNQYRNAVRTVLASGDVDKAQSEVAQLASFAGTRESKAAALAAAYEQVKGSNKRVFIAPDTNGNWVTTPTKQENGLTVNGASFRLRDDVQAEAQALRTAADALQAMVTANPVPVQPTAPTVAPEAAVAQEAPTVEPVVEAAPVVNETGELTALRNRTGVPVDSTNYTKVNLLGELFSQESGKETDATQRPLAAVKDFVTKVRSGQVNLRDFLNQKEEASPNQRAAINRFFTFQREFDKFIQQGFTRRRDPNFRFQDYNQFLINEDGSVDENVRTAISFGSFTWIAENTNSLFNTQEGINMILGRDSADEVSAEAYAKLGKVGTREDVVANQLGGRIVQALGIKARPEAAANEQAKLESAIGIAAIGAMQRAGLLTRTEISDATMKRLQNSTDKPTKDLHIFVNLSTVEVDGRVRANEDAQKIREATTGSQSVLNKVFSVEASGTEPSYQPVKFDQKLAKRTQQEIPKVLASTLNKEGTKAHRVKQDSHQIWGLLSTQGLYRIAGVINDRPVHMANAASRQAKNEGLMAQVDNYNTFINKMIADPTTQGIEQPLYFGRSVWKPQRVGLSTNVINPQTSKVHRHMLAMDGWESTIDPQNLGQMNNFKLRVLEAFGKKTEAKATALVLKDFDAVVGNPVVQAGVEAIATALRGETDMTAFNESVILDAVEATDNNFHGLDGLIALAHLKNSEGKPFKTTFMGEVDGLTNGPALSMLMLGAKDADTMQQTGFFGLDSAYDQFNDFKGDGGLDSYESSIKGALGQLDARYAPQLAALQVITGQLLTDEGNVSSKGRNVVKKPFTAMMFGSNTSTAVADMAQGFVDSIYSKMEDAAATHDEQAMKNILNAVNVLIDNKGKKLDPNMGITVAMETVLDAKQQEDIRMNFFSLLGQHVQNSLEANYATFIARRDVVNQTAQLSFRLYNAAYDAMVKQVEQTSPSIATRETKDGKKQVLRTLTSAELREVRNKLKSMEPVLMTAMAKKSNQLDAGMHMSKTKRELDNSLPFSSEVYFGEEVTSFNEEGKEIKRATTRVSGLRTLAIDPGVAPFITAIHSTDSAIASQVYGGMNALNVHDALGVGLHSVEEVGQKLNQATYENMRDYSAPSEMVNTMERVLTGLNEVMQDPVLAAAIQPELKKISAELQRRNLGSITEHLERVRDAAMESDTEKLSQLVNMKAVGQYATEGGSYMVTDADRAIAQKTLDAVGSNFTEAAMAAAVNLDTLTAAQPMDLQAAAAKALSNNSVQTLSPATTLNTLERLEQTPEVQAVREALETNIPLESAKAVLDAPKAAKVVQEVATNTGPKTSVWGELGVPLVESNQVLVDLLSSTKMTARDLITSLETLNTDGFRGRLLAMIKRTVPADMPINYVTSETGPEGALGRGVNKARGWYHQDTGTQAIYVKSPEFVESGITVEMLTHELVHAALAQVVNSNMTGNSEAAKAVRDLMSLRTEAANFLSRNSTLQAKYRNATTNVHELLAWGLTNQGFQQEVLAKVESKSTSNALLNGLTAFIDMMTRLLFRGNATKADRTGLGQLVQQSAGLFREASKLREARNKQTLTYEDAVDHVNAMTAEEVFTALEGASPRVSSTTHQMHLVDILRSTVEPLYGPYGAFKAEASADRAITPMDVYLKSLNTGRKPFASAALASPFHVNQQEGFVLESVQAAMETAMSHGNTQFIRQGLSNLFNEASKTLSPAAFHNGDWSTATPTEKDIAQQKYDFLFKLSPGVTNKSAHLAQFAAMGLASEEVRNILQFSTANAQQPLKSLPWASLLVELFRRVMTKLAELHTKVSPGERADVALETLVNQLVDIEAKRKGEMAADKLGQLDQLEVALGNVGNNIRSRAEILGNMPFFTQSKSGYIRGAGGLLRTVAGDRLGEGLDYLTAVRDRAQRQKNGIIMGLVEEARGIYDGNKLAADLFKGAKFNEKLRKDAIEHTVANVNSSFKDGGAYLTQEDRADLTRVLLRTNSSVLTSSYGLARFQEMLEKPNELKTERVKVEQQLKGMTQHWGYMQAAAKDLAYHKVVGGNVSHNLMLNTRNIARLLGTNVADTLSTQDVNNLVPVLDKLMAMYALDYSSTAAKNRVIQVMRTEANRTDGNGIDMITKLHAGLQDRSAKELFAGQETLQQSAYVPEIHDTKIEVLLVPRDKVEAHEKAGYKLGTELQKDTTDSVKDDRVLMTRRGAGQTGLVTGALSFTGMHRKGSGPDYQTVNLMRGKQMTSKQQVAMVKQAKASHVADLFARGFTYDPRKVKAGVMVPVLDPSGGVVDFRYTMTEHNRDALLDRDSSMDQVLGTLAGQIVDKTSTIDQNADVVRAMHDQYRAEYAANPARFLKFGKDSTDPDMLELYRILPESTKREIKRVWRDDNMMIPTNQLNLITGYRKYSLTSAFNKPERDLKQRAQTGERNWAEQLFVQTTRAILGEKAALRVGQAEDMMQELVKEAKDILVVKNIVTLMGNMMSNISVLMMEGVSMKDIVSSHAVAIKGALDYRKDLKKVNQLRQAMEIGYVSDVAAMEQELTQAQDRLARNPIKPLIDAGLMPTIVEDVEADDSQYSYKSRMQRGVEKYTSRVPKLLREAGKQVYMTHDTSTYKFLSQTTQLSDLVARYALHQHLISRQRDPLSNADALTQAEEAFVNYDLPSHRSIQFMNDMGLVMFTKYYIRIQKVIARMVREKPARVLAGVAASHMIDGLQTVMDSTWINRIGNNPFQWGAFNYLGTLDELPVIKMLN